MESVSWKATVREATALYKYTSSCSASPYFIARYNWIYTGTILIINTTARVSSRLFIWIFNSQATYPTPRYQPSKWAGTAAVAGILMPD
jgi:hypothetical protein